MRESSGKPSVLLDTSYLQPSAGGGVPRRRGAGQNEVAAFGRVDEPIRAAATPA